MNMKKSGISLAVVLFAAIAGMVIQSCTTSIDQSVLAKPAIQFGVIKLIQDSDGDITKTEVLDFVKTVRGLVNESGQVDVTALFDEVTAMLDVAELSAQEEVVVNALLEQAQQFVNEIDLLDEGKRVAIGTILEWVEEAALMVPDNA